MMGLIGLHVVGAGMAPRQEDTHCRRQETDRERHEGTINAGPQQQILRGSQAADLEAVETY